MRGGHQRLLIEKIDPAVQSRGLCDLAALFGEVLDCKVERSSSVNDEAAGGCLGFVHYAQEQEATKARTFLNGMQIGESVLQVRPFEAKDVSLFTGCSYTAGCFDEDPQGEINGNSVAPGAKARTSPQLGPDEADVLEIFQQLSYHYVEVLQDRSSKLRRLRSLLELYEPNHEQQIVVVAEAANMKPISGTVSEYCEEVDIATVDAATLSKSAPSHIAEISHDFEHGNIYVLIVDHTALAKKDFVLKNPAPVLVFFDLPKSLPEYLRGIAKRARVDSRVHGFLSPNADQALCQPLLAAMEEAGHEMEPSLFELVSR